MRPLWMEAHLKLWAIFIVWGHLALAVAQEAGAHQRLALHELRHLDVLSSRTTSRLDTGMLRAFKLRSGSHLDAQNGCCEYI